MFIVVLTYLVPIEIIDKHIVEHRAYLDEGYKLNYFIASGPQNPRTGGIILSQLKEKKLLEEILNNDPFIIHQVAEYKIIEFNPIKYHSSFSAFIQ